MTPETHCILCSGSRSRAFHEENGHRYRQCLDCGMVFLHPRPSDEELHALYQAETGATFHHAAESAEAHEKRLEASWRYSIVERHLDLPRRALEVGCGAGYFLELLRGRGWEVEGVEAAESYIRFARETFGIELRRDLRECRGPFGAAFLFNVLSHLPHPERDLRDVRDRLVDGGVLICETGNAAEVPPWRVGHFGAPDHIYHLNEANLRSLLGRCGYRDVRVRRFNVEWQRRLLSFHPRKGGAARRSPGPTGGGGGWKRKLLTRALLEVRYNGGRFLADPQHFCTLIVVARR